MKNRFKQGFLLMTIATLGIFISCGTDDPPIVIDSDLSIQFNSTGTAVVESASPIKVTLTFPAAPVDITVIADVTGTATYTDDYTTAPAVVNKKISIDIVKGATSATFTLTPVDDEDVDSSRVVIFTLASAKGISLGTNTTYEVIITDDETAKVVKTISEIRALYDGSADVPLTEEWYIQGMIVSKGDNINSQNVAIQDASAGIVVRFANDNTLDFGDVVEIALVGGTIGNFNDLVQISLENTAASVTSTASTVTASTITVTMMKTGDYESQYVQIDGVTFPGADGNATVSGNNTISDGTEGVLRVGATATFASTLKPFGTGSVVGVVSIFNGISQLTPQAREDIFMSSPTTTMAVTSNGTDNFGMVRTSLTSASQSYTVALTGATVDVTATPPSGYEVSLDDMTFTTDSVVLTAAASSTLYARFAPTSGAQGTISGDIVFTAVGVLPQSVTLTGVENGSGLTSPTTNDLFFSEYVEGSSNNKYLEIFNGTGSDIDLSDYEIHRNNNGAGDGGTTNTYPLLGTLASGDVIVIAHSRADVNDTGYTGTPYSATDVSGVTFYNGDDVVMLYKVSTMSFVDIIGHYGCDPGTAWTDGEHSTLNKTLRRKGSIRRGVEAHLTGNCDPTSFLTLTTEWDVFDVNTGDGLGSHTLTN